MAVKERPTPDEFEKPTARSATEKSTVTAVLSRVVQHGNSLLSVLFGLLAAAMILFSGYILYDTAYTSGNAASAPFELLKYRPEIIDDSATPAFGSSTLAEINKDYRAWLVMYGSNIDYPVMQGADDTHYANYDVYGNSSRTGALYMSAFNAPDLSDSYNIIYGHHMDNKAMFGALDLYMDSDYFYANREGILISQSGVFDLRTFAVITTDAYESMIYTVGDRFDAVTEYIRAMQVSSDGRTEVLIFDESALTGADKIVAFSTCMSMETYGRLVVLSVMERRNLIEFTADDYEGVYDAESHGPVGFTLNYEENTTVSHSLDGGVTWIDGLPSVTDVGETTVTIRAENPYYGFYESDITLKVTPKPITIKVLDSFKVYGTDDPEFKTAEIEGILDGFEPEFILRRTNLGSEDVGVYPGVLVAEGETLQGNYEFIYEPGDFSITRADTLALLVNGYSGPYDGEEHSLTRLEVNVPQNTVFYFSTDGGATWSTEMPSIKDVGMLSVTIRAENPNYDPLYASVDITIKPKDIIVRADDASKEEGKPDPKFTATVTGLLGDDTVIFSVKRPGAGKDEKPGVYTDALVPDGTEFQGNYHLVMEAGTFTITPSNEEIDDPGIPLIDFIDRFIPSPVSGTPAWALVNLIALIITLYTFMPLLRLRDKYMRGKTMKRINENEASDGTYQLGRYRGRLFTGLGLEILITAATLLLFILTENLRTPMVLIDKWTPVMIVLMALCITVDMLCFKKTKKEEKDGEETADAT